MERRGRGVAAGHSDCFSGKGFQRDHAWYVGHNRPGLASLYKRSSAVTAGRHLCLHVQEQIYGPGGLSVCLIVLNAFPFFIRCIPSGQDIIQMPKKGEVCSG